VRERERHQSDAAAHAEELVAGYLDGAADERQVAELNALLTTDATARRLYVSMCVCDAAMKSLAMRQGEPMATDGDAIVEVLDDRPLRPLWAWRRFAAAAALVIFAALAVTLLMSPGAVVATVVSAERSSSLLTGQSLREGRTVVLDDGVLHRRLTGGAEVRVVGPGALTLASPTTVRLDHGAMVARNDGGGELLVVSKPMTVRDVGTEFGVWVGQADAAQLHVFEGSVEATAGGRVTRLEAGKALRVAQGGVVSSVDLDAARFAWAWRRPGTATDEPIMATFDAGAGTDSPGQFPGTWGEGWLDGWVVRPDPGLRVDSVGIANNRPLRDGGGPFLAATGTATASASHDGKRKPRMALNRRYVSTPTFDMMRPHRIRFSYRFDAPLDQLGEHGRIALFDSTEVAATTNPDRTTWTVEADASEGRWTWSFAFAPPETRHDSNSYRRLDTGIALRPGVTYRVTIDVDPANSRWAAEISDGERTVHSDSLHGGSPMPFRNGATRVGGVVAFNVAVSRPGQMVAFALDDLIIEPLEPTDADTPANDKPITKPNSAQGARP